MRPGATGEFRILRKDVQKREFYLQAALNENPHRDGCFFWAFDETSPLAATRAVDIGAAGASTEVPVVVGIATREEAPTGAVFTSAARASPSQPSLSLPRCCKHAPRVRLRKR